MKGGRPLVLVTGAGGFVGGHVARGIAQEKRYRVRGLVRRPPRIEPGDPEIEWVSGDLRSSEDRQRAVAGSRFVIHCASWVRLGHDPDGNSVAVNVEATRGLLAASLAAGVERFVYTSTLQTIAAGTAEIPAIEASRWNLNSVRSPYTETKRAAEAMVLAANSGTMATMALCPAMAIGPRDSGPTSTGVVLEMSRVRVVTLPAGGIPVVAVETLAAAHANALDSGEPGTRYAVAGPYLSYRDLARLVTAVSGRPQTILNLPDWTERALAGMAGGIDRASRGRWPAISRAVLAGGFLRFHVSGERADRAFGLVHEPPSKAIVRTLEWAKRSGLAPWLRDRVLRGEGGDLLG